MSAVDDIWDQYPDYDDFESDTDVQCKFCKRSGFHWGEWWNKKGVASFRLFTAAGRLHDCRTVKPDADGFDVVPE